MNQRDFINLRIYENIFSDNGYGIDLAVVVMELEFIVFIFLIIFFIKMVLLA